ncbi:MAG TPA: HAD-IA family hydrolase [Candidatus Saccharimonadales bacterium]
MNDTKVLLFDVDGVLALPPKLFSEIYSSEYGVDINELQPFYKSEDFKDAILGKADLKELIIKHSDKWHWHKDPQILLDMWFEGEHVVNNELLSIVNKLRDKGIPVYLATQQENYRAKYINDIMFPNKFDGSFVSCDIGHTKQEPEYWNYIIKKLNNYTPKNIYFFDDTQSCVDAAKIAGINSFLYNSVEQVSTILGI